MNIHEAAAKLDGNEYGSEGSDELFEAMRAEGLVAVFGYSDDNIELRGAINDEISAYDGGEFHVAPEGLVQNKCENDACPYHERELDGASKVEAVWGEGEFSWQYRTTIPNAKFKIMEDGEPYCEGIVFALADISP